MRDGTTVQRLADVKVPRPVIGFQKDKANSCRALFLGGYHEHRQVCYFLVAVRQGWVPWLLMAHFALFIEHAGRQDPDNESKWEDSNASFDVARTALRLAG